MRVLPATALAVALAFSPALLPAQTPAQAAQRTPEQMQADWERHKGDFDYLLGDWEYSSVSKEWGPGHGRWSAVKLTEGQVLDEWRITGDSGETVYMTTTLRSYNARLDRWELIGMDEGRGLQDFGTGQRMGNEVRIEQRFGVGGPAPSLWKIRYYNIQPDRFSWTADRSTDEGKTWTPQYLTIEARRIGPARTLPPLAVSGFDAAAEARRNFQEVSGWVLKAAEMVPENRYGFRPAETVRTYGQLVAHLVDSYTWYCAQAQGQNIEWSDAVEQSGASRAAVLAQLRQATDRCAAVYAAGGRARALVDNVAHTSLHYGNIVTYLRAMGLVPPSS